MSDVPPPPVAPMEAPPPQQDFISRNKWWVLGGIVVLGAGGLLLYEHKKNSTSSSSSPVGSGTPQYYELAPGTLTSGSSGTGTQGSAMSSQWTNQQQLLQQDISSLQSALQTYQGEVATAGTSPSNTAGSVNNNASTA
jgi:hypothetical protein